MEHVPYDPLDVPDVKPVGSFMGGQVHLPKL